MASQSLPSPQSEYSLVVESWVANEESWVANELTSLATFLRNHQQTTSKVNSKWQFCFSLFWGTELIVNIVTRNNIVWKLARCYCLCYCKTFSLVPDFTGCIKNVLLKRVVHYLCHLKSNNIIGQRKTTNKEKHFYPWLSSFNLKLSCT